MSLTTKVKQKEKKKRMKMFDHLELELFRLQIKKVLLCVSIKPKLLLKLDFIVAGSSMF